MCGRFSVTFDQKLLEARFQATFAESLFQPRYNAAPSQALPVILNTEPQTIQRLAWGLRPAWARTIGKKDGIINVRAETLRERQTFKKDLAERRCLVLADSFYEWRKEAGKRKTPFRILLKMKEPFAFAGIWEENEGRDGESIQTFAIITTESNSLVAEGQIIPKGSQRTVRLLIEFDEPGIYVVEFNPCKRWLADCVIQKYMNVAEQ
jgi:putative SOS response-associated peptidase YedK